MWIHHSFCSVFFCSIYYFYHHKKKNPILIVKTKTIAIRDRIPGSTTYGLLEAGRQYVSVHYPCCGLGAT